MASPAITRRTRSSGAAIGPAVGALKPICIANLPVAATILHDAGAGDCRYRPADRRGVLVMSERRVDDVQKAGQLAELMAQAARLRDQGHGRLISYSRKVF